MHCCIVRWQLQTERSELPIDRTACAYDDVFQTRLLLQLVGELLQVAAIECKGVSNCAVIHIAQIVCNVVMDGTSLHLVQGGLERKRGLEIQENSMSTLILSPPERLRSNMAKIYEMSKKVTLIWKKKKQRRKKF